MISHLLAVNPTQVKLLNAVPAAKINLTPSSLDVTTIDSQQIGAEVIGANGAVMPNASVAWNVYGGVGSITSSGLFSASTVGTGYIEGDVTNPAGDTVSARIPVTVKPPAYLAFQSANLGIFMPTQTVSLVVDINDANGHLNGNDNGRPLQLTITGPDGSHNTYSGNSQNGMATFNFNETMAGAYTAQVSAPGSIAGSPAVFQVVPGDATSLQVHVSPSTFIKPTQIVSLKANFYDNWNNLVPNKGANFSVSNSVYGKLAVTDDPSVATFTAANVKGVFTVTATAGNLTGSQSVEIYTSNADLVTGKGDWMLWSDWKNYPVDQTIKRLQAAGVTHVYLEVSTTSDGFYGQDALNDFLPKAHQAGIVVMGWVYAKLSVPWQDAAQSIQVIQYKTPSGDQIDGLAADLEENLTSASITSFSSGIRSTIGSYYPMVAVVYPASWTRFAHQPWDVYQKYYDVMAPMVYWHYTEMAYTYKDAYQAIENELIAMHKATQNMPVTIVGQSYNMFDDWQYPQAGEIKGAMQAAKDYGAIGYSTYRGRTATPDEWMQFSGFQW